MRYQNTTPLVLSCLSVLLPIEKMLSRVERVSAQLTGSLMFVKPFQYGVSLKRLWDYVVFYKLCISLQFWCGFCKKPIIMNASLVQLSIHDKWLLKKSISKNTHDSSNPVQKNISILPQKNIVYSRAEARLG